MVSTAPDAIDVVDFQFREHLRLTTFKPSQFGEVCNLVTVASRYGLIFVAGESAELQVIQVKDIETFSKDVSEFKRRIVPLPSKTLHISVNCDSTKLAVVIVKENCPHALFYDVLSFLGQNIKMVNHTSLSQNPQTKIIQIDWNPALPDIFTAAKSDGSLLLYEFKGAPIELPPAAGATCFCWSPKGKQLAVGGRDGRITQYKTDLKAVKAVAAPPDFTTIISLCWVSSFQFFGVYTNTAGENCLICVDAPKTGGVSFMNFYDVCYSNGDSRPQQFYLIHQMHWNVLYVSSSNSAEIAILGMDANGKWTQWNLSDNSRAALPLGGKHEETLPIGLAFNVGVMSFKMEGEFKQAPSLYVLSNYGSLCVFNVINSRTGAMDITTQLENVADRSGEQFFVVTTAQVALSSENKQPSAQGIPALGQEAPSFGGSNLAGTNFGVALAVSSAAPSLTASSTATPSLTASLAAPSLPTLGQPLTTPSIGLPNLPGLSIKPVGMPAPQGLFNSTMVAPSTTSKMASSLFSLPVASTAPFVSKPSLGASSSITPPTSIPLTSGINPTSSASFSMAATSTVPHTYSKTTLAPPPTFIAPPTSSVAPPTSLPPSTSSQPPPSTPETPPTPSQTQNNQPTTDKLPITEETEAMIADLVREECTSLEMELQDLLQRGELTTTYRIGQDQEMTEMARRAQDIEVFYEEIKETINAHDTEVYTLKQNLLKTWACFEEARTRFVSSRNPVTKVLLQSMDLDPAAQDRRDEIARMMYYIDSQLMQANQSLDEQWDAFQNSMKRSSKLQLPTMESIYQSMVRHCKTVQRQKYMLQHIHARIMASTRSKDRTLMNMTHSVADVGVENLEEELSKMKLQQAVLPESYNRLLERQSKMSASKVRRLQTALANREASRVCVSKPQLNNSTIQLTTLFSAQLSPIGKKPPQSFVQKMLISTPKPLGPAAHGLTQGGVFTGGKPGSTALFPGGKPGSSGLLQGGTKSVVESKAKPDGLAALFKNPTCDTVSGDAEPKITTPLFTTPSVVPVPGPGNTSSSVPSSGSSDARGKGFAFSTSNLPAVTSDTIKPTMTSSAQMGTSNAQVATSSARPSTGFSFANIGNSSELKPKPALLATPTTPPVGLPPFGSNTSTSVAPPFGITGLFSSTVSSSSSGIFGGTAGGTTVGAASASIGTSGSTISAATSNQGKTGWNFGKTGLTTASTTPFGSSMSGNIFGTASGGTTSTSPTSTAAAAPWSFGKITPATTTSTSVAANLFGGSTQSAAKSSIFGADTSTSTASTGFGSVGTTISSSTASTSTPGTAGPTTSFFGTALPAFGAAGTPSTTSTTSTSTTGFSFATIGTTPPSSTIFGGTPSGTPTSTVADPMKTSEKTTGTLSALASTSTPSTSKGETLGSSGIVASDPVVSPPAVSTPAVVSKVGVATSTLSATITTPTTTPAATTTSLFGGTATTTSGLGAIGSGLSLFATTSTAEAGTSVSSGTSIFGTAITAPTTTGNFEGSSTSTALGKPTTGNIFGSVTSTDVTGSAGTATSASTAQTVTPLTTTSVSTFGGAPFFGATTSAFGTTSTSASTPSPFGAAATTSTFGASASVTTSATTAFGTGSVGTTTPTPAFGSGSIFGGKPTQPAFGTAMPFGGPVATVTASPFGAAASTTSAGTTPFGTASGGATLATTTPFGTAAVGTTSPFAAMSSTTATTAGFGFNSGNLFAAPAKFTTPSGIFGGATPTTSSATPFGAASSSSGSIFGGTPTTTVASPFGATSAGTSGFAPLSNSPFGQAAATPAFGVSPSTFGGQPQTPPAFGTPAATPTSSAGNTFSGFGGLSMGGGNTFGQSPAATPPANPFGAKTDPKPFGSGMSTNLFASPAAGASSSSSSIFGSKPSQPFGASSSFGSAGFGHQSTFGSPGGGFGNTSAGGAFSSGGGQSVQQAGFGSPSGFQKASGGGFGSAPVFGSPPAFGGGANFGASPTFGGGATFGSPGKVFGAGGTDTTTAPFGSAGAQSSFGSIAQQNTVGFGNLAQQAAAPASSMPFSGGSSFTNWRN